MTAEDQNNPFRPTISGIDPASSQEVSSGRATYNIVTDTIFGVNTRKSDNAFQAKVTFGSVLFFASVGITLALLNPNWEVPWFAGAFVGAFVGLVVGIFASGIILMVFRLMQHMRGKHD